MGLHSEAGLDKKFIEFAKLMNIYLNHFPNHERHGLALEIRRAAYEMYGLIIECQKRYHKKTTLTCLDIRHEQLRMLIRLAGELEYFGFKDGKKGIDKGKGERRYLVLSALIDELGRMIGGWIVGFIGETLHLELSRSTIASRARGLNFVGYRTWASRRFVRRRSLYNFRQALKKGKIKSLVSILGHARRTHSLLHLINSIKEKNNALYCQLPKACQRVHHNHPARPGRDGSADHHRAVRTGRPDLCVGA